MTSTLDARRGRAERSPVAAPGTAAADPAAPRLGFSWTDGEWFLDLERTDDRCRAFLEQVRWPEGVLCPRCDSHEVGRLEARRKFYCRSCKYQFSVTAQTIFHNSHLPLWKWFLTIFLMLQSEAGFPANRLVHFLGGSYKTAWFALHRVRTAIEEMQRISGCDNDEACRCLLEGVNGRIDGNGACVRLFERPIVGPYHQMAVKYVGAYVAELEWRLQSRDNPNAFRDTVLALAQTEPVEYTDLIRRSAAFGPTRR